MKGYAGTYFDVRIWSAPAAFANYTILGWLLGTGRTGMALFLQLVLNGINIILAIVFVLLLGWGIPGVAAATLTSEVLAACGGLFLVSRLLPRVAVPKLFDRHRMLRVLHVNANIMIRTLCLEAAFVTFTFAARERGRHRLRRQCHPDEPADHERLWSRRLRHGGRDPGRQRRRRPRPGRVSRRHPGFDDLGRRAGDPRHARSSSLPARS